MKITVKLFATFREYLPKDAVNAAFGVELAEERTVQELIKTLHLPEEIPKIVLVNGRQTEDDIALHEADTVSIFPPLAGGRQGSIEFIGSIESIASTPQTRWTDETQQTQQTQ